MKQPKPLLREGASDFERQLLSAVMRERPSPQLHSRMRRTLGLTGALAWASSVKAMLGSLAGKGAVSVAILGLVAAGATGVLLTRGESDGNGVSDSASQGASATQAAVPELAPPSDERAPPSPNVNSGELREEILLLDQARAALQQGSRAAALEQLDQYRRRFPAGILSREAAQLRQQASTGARPSSRAR